MGFSVSGSTAIIAVALLVCAGTVTTAVSTTYDDVSDARSERAAGELARTNTDFDVVYASYDGVTDTLTVRANNTGTTVLDISDLSFLVDNTLLRPAGSTVDGDADTDLWLPGEQLEVQFTDLSLDLDFQGGPSRVKVVSGAGVSRASAV